MPTYVKVCINGFVLSTLLFDCANNSGDQEGFLYGSITRNVRREISDQSMSNTQEDILISICSSVPCGSFLSFYNNVGEINRGELEYNLGDRVENIVGWYRYRRYSAMYPSAREQVIHRKLRALFANSGCVDDSYFVFGLLSSSNLPNFATHSFDYAFFTQRIDETFKNLNLTILNLGDTRNSYRAGSLALPFMNSSSFHSVLSSSWNFNSFYETEDQIQQFHQRLRMKLESLQEELAASDAVNATLEDDIRRLSNEMQSLLATQERLTSAARETKDTDKRVDEITEQKETESSSFKQEETVTKSKVSRSNNSAVSQACESSGAKEVPKAEENVLLGRESPRLKRSAMTPLESDQVKRSCPDKYFESSEFQDDTLEDKTLTQSTNTAPEISSSKQEDNVLSSSQMLVVDPDSGEMSTAHSEVENLKSEVASCQLQESSIPSPASTVEIVISGVEIHRLVAQVSAIVMEFTLLCLASLMLYGLLSAGAGEDIPEDSGSSTSEELSDMKESPELSDIKESNSESATSPKEVVTSGPSSLSSKTADSEQQSEMISSTTQDLSEKLAINENILSGCSATRASSSDESSGKANRPFIIYASKDLRDSTSSQTPSCSEQGLESEESQPKDSSDDKSEVKSGPSSSSDQSDDGKKDKI